MISPQFLGAFPWGSQCPLGLRFPRSEGHQGPDGRPGFGADPFLWRRGLCIMPGAKPTAIRAGCPRFVHGSAINQFGAAGDVSAAQIFAGTAFPKPGVAGSIPAGGAEPAPASPEGRESEAVLSLSEHG